jgi:Cu(I)/Ag(I) efflux system membrane fusion protein
MVYDDRGANWIQQDPELLNPYFGASMLRCGETREVLGETEEKGESHDH